MKPLWRSLRKALALDLTALEHIRPVRAALVILAALTYTYVNHDVRPLLPLGLGLLFAAIADRGSSLRRRVCSMAGASIGITIGIAIGCAVSNNQLLHITTGGLVGLLCGLVGVASIPATTLASSPWSSSLFSPVRQPIFSNGRRTRFSCCLVEASWPPPFPLNSASGRS